MDLDGCVDLLGESLTLPEELSALAEDDGFPSRPIVVPDELNVELRGALLLPSDSGSSRTGYSSYEDLMTRVIAEGESSKNSSLQGDDQFFSGSQIDLGSMESPHCRAAAAVVADAARAIAASPGRQGASPAPSGSSGPRVGISTAEITPSSNSQSSKSRDWSLSDTDLRELLEQGNSLAEMGSGSVTTPVAAPSAGPAGSNLPSVPETGVTVGGDMSYGFVSHTRLQTFEGATVHSSPSSHSHSSAATTSCDTSGSSPPRSVRTRSISGASSELPAQSMSSRTHTTVRSSPPQSTNTGTGSNSLLTNWSSAARSSAAIRNSLTQSNSVTQCNSVTQSGSGTHSTSLVSPVTNFGYQVCDDDILETSINSNFSDLL